MSKTDSWQAMSQGRKSYEKEDKGKNEGGEKIEGVTEV